MPSVERHFRSVTYTREVCSQSEPNIVLSDKNSKGNEEFQKLFASYPNNTNLGQLKEKASRD